MYLISLYYIAYLFISHDKHNLNNTQLPIYACYMYNLLMCCVFLCYNL